MQNKKSKFFFKFEIQIYRNKNAEVSECRRVVERLFDDYFIFFEDDSNDEEGEGIFAYARQQHIDDATKVAGLSRGVISIRIDFSTGRSVPEGDGTGNKGATDSKGQEDEFSGKNKRDNRI